MDMDIELLAPAGSYEALEAAFSAGADAVYIGGSQFGARAYADNLDEEKMCRAIDLAHLQGKKLYLTVNTLLKDSEIEEQLFRYLLPYYREGLDGVIVQDFGVLELIREAFPLLPIHASTQMAVTGASGARVLKELGVKRVVTARELSLAEISDIRKQTNIEIESFVHGALCYCYSGQCLMSSLIGGRSGNRGRCAQPCRLPYEVFEKGKRLNSDKTAYPLNTKDMCTLELLPEIIRAGVTSLKIEGRMKKPEYTAGVVSVYRKYLDLYRENPENYQVQKADLKLLFDLFNRDGFNQSYYLERNGRDMMALRNEKLTSDRQDHIQPLYQKIRDRWISEKLQTGIDGRLKLEEGRPARLTLVYGSFAAEVEKEGIQAAKNQPVTEERVRVQMEKTGNSPFCFQKLEIEMEDRLFIPMQVLNELRREALGRLEKAVLDAYRRDVPAPERKAGSRMRGRAAGTGQEQDSGEKRRELWGSVETFAQLRVLEEMPGIYGIYLPVSLFAGVRFYEETSKTTADLLKKGKGVRLALPHITRAGEDGYYMENLKKLAEDGVDGFLVRNLEDFGLLKERGLEDKVILDAGMYTMNGCALQFWEKQGVFHDTVPLELNQKEIRSRENAGSEMILYGRAPMMISAQCLKKNLDRCTHSHAMLSLRDRMGKQFPVACCCDSCYNVIYNSLPTSLLTEAEAVQKAGCASYRLCFTVEDEEETRSAALRFVDAYVYGKKADEEISEYTRGHYKRGVE